VLTRGHLAWAVAALLAALAPAAGAAQPLQPGALGFAHRPVCGAVPVRVARCNSQVIVDVTGAPLVTAGPSGYGPSDLQSAYGLTSLASSVGATQTIAIVDAYDAPSAESDLGVYRSQFGLSPCTTANGCFRKVDQRGGTTYPKSDGGWAQEISLDLDMASAICPNCHILLVEADSPQFTDLAAAVDRAATLGATQISNSYGGNEFSSETTSTYESHYDHPGIAVTVSSGDNGYGVEFPASSRYVTAVGGTSLTVDGSARGWSESAWSGAGSGCSAYVPKPSWQTDSGCTRRTVADVSAVADPNTGVAVYDSLAFHGSSGWMVFGGTSVASPVVAAFDALIGSTAATRSYPYDNASSFNDVTSGGNGSCGGSYLCTAKVGYDGPTGVGTPMGATPSGPKPSVTTQAASSIVATTATLNGTVNPNGLSTTYHFDYGTTTAYGSQTTATSAGSGTTASPVSAALSGLSSSTTYHFRLVATSSAGTSNGTDQTFTTGAAPVVTTQAASSVGASSATLNGTVNPGRLATTYHFEYGTTTAYGSQSPAVDASAGSGSTAVSVSTALSSLTAGTTYHFRLVATNAAGATLGSDLMFTTLTPPVATTGTATSVIDTGATLNGTVDANGTATTYHFEYGTTASYGSQTAATSAGSGTSPVSESAAVTGLSPGTTYHFRIVATSAAGTSNGSDQTFTTGVKPSVTTQPATALAADGATLNGSVNPNGYATSYHFEYGTTTAYGSQTTSLSAGSGSTAVAESAAISGLTAGATYHFRLVATNSAGTTVGADLTLTTLTPPVATTGSASSVLDTSATLNGTVDPNGSATSYHFDYGTTASYGSQTASSSAGSGSSAVSESAGVTGLSPGTTYHFRLVATSAAGTSNGADQTFTTGAAPIVMTQAASSIGAASATLNGTVNPSRLATTYHFEYGTTTAYGSQSPAVDASAGSGSTAVAESAAISGLTAGTTYHFRLVATNSAGTTDGGDLTLTTLTPPVATTGSASSVLDTSATLNGTVDPNGSATSYHFEYGTTTAYGSQSPAADADAGSGSSAVPVSTTLSGLFAATTYHFRLVATNAAGTTVSADRTLTTSDVVAPPPPADTLSTTTTTPTVSTLVTSANACSPTLRISRRRHTAIVRISCAPAGTITASALRGTRRIARTSRTLVVAGAPTLRLRIPRRAFARVDSLRLTVKVTIVDAAGARTVLRRRVTIRR
jgi:hypothetical protein